MTEHYHAVIWIDHREARVFHFNADDVDEQVVHPHDPTVHLHVKANQVGSGHAEVDKKFMHQVTAAVAQSKAILITGPASAKNELMKHMEHHDPLIAKCVAGVEAIDHPTDGELIDHARKFFRTADKMTPQKA